ASSVIFNALIAATGTNTLDNTNYGQTWNWSTGASGNQLALTANALSNGTLLALSSTTTAAASNTQKLLSLDLSGNLANSNQTTYCLYASNTHTNNSSVNVAL